MVICEKCGHHNLSKSEDKNRSTLYNVWIGIKKRCYSVNDKYYDRYGGRGIKMCDEWRNNFELFYHWALKNGWQKGLHIDRIENDGNYSPENCRCVTNAMNQKNRRNNIKITFNNKVMILSDVARLKGINIRTLWDRIFKWEWDIDKAIETPTRKYIRK